LLESPQVERIAYVDCLSGISGDMFIGALLDAGLPQKVLHRAFDSLGLNYGEIELTTKREAGEIAARSFNLRLPAGSQEDRGLSEITRIIKQAPLSTRIKGLSLDIFTLLAQAEAKVHQSPIEDIHFHEVGAIDAICDIVGAAAGLEYFNIKHLYASPLPMPRGQVECAHGTLPLPAPAVCELLRGAQVYGVELSQELVTPTGAAILQGSKAAYGPMPAMEIESVGYGAGRARRKDGQANILRLIIGRRSQVAEAQEVSVIESHIDDSSPELMAYLCQRLSDGGALDVSLCPIQMKKGRPGWRLTVIAPPSLAYELEEIILTESSAIGLRRRLESRRTLPREYGTLPTPWGRIAAKRVTTSQGKRITPEYEACRRLAQERNIPIAQVFAAAARCGDDDFLGEDAVKQAPRNEDRE